MDVVAKLNEALSGSYRLEREVGSGGMATVYSAEDLKHHRRVAIKVLRHDLASTVGADRFLREIEIAANLQHPHILPLLDSGQVDGLVFYVMPFVDGGTLGKRLIREGELPIAEALRILIGIVDALAHAHDHDVVHRDIKPDNVMLSGRHPFVTDFGIARAISQSSEHADLTTIGVALGTPAYMSPEQAAADPHVDHRTDLYSVGVVAYEMLTGHPPFSGHSPQQILAAQVTEEPPPVTLYRPGVGAELEGIVMRCLDKRAANRWQTAGELLTKLEGLVTPSGGTPPTSAKLPPASAPGRRGRWIAGGIVAVLAVALAFGWLLRQGGRSPGLPTLGQSARVTTGDGLATHAAISPDGTLVAYAAGDARRMRVYIQALGGGRRITLSEDSVAFEYQPRWSPDGTRIVYLTPEGARVASALGGTSRLVAGASERTGPLSAPMLDRFRAVNAAAWAPDGDHLFIARGGALSIASLGPEPETPLGILPNEVHACDWSRDGRWIACTSGNGEGAVPGNSFGNLAPSSIVLIDPADGATRTLAGGTFLNDSPVWASNGRRLFFVSNRDGPRDVYVLELDASGDPAGPPRRVTTGLGALSIVLSADENRLLYVEYSARSNLWKLPMPASATSVSEAVPVTSEDQIVEAMAVSPDQAWIVYDSNLFGNADIFRVPVGGGAPERLTDHPADDFAAAVSPDGSTIAFHSWRSGTRDIFVQALGGPARQVTSTDSQESYPWWSWDGGTLFYYDQLFTGGSTRGVYRLDADGSGGWRDPVLVRAGSGRGAAIRGDSIVYVVFDGGGIEIAPTRGGDPRTVYAPRPDSEDPQPELTVPSVDGREIYFKTHGPDGRASIWVVSRAGGAPRLLVDFDDPDRPSIRPDFAAGAGHLFFTLEDRRSTVWTVELTGR